jgi:hypothetical protein
MLTIGYRGRKRDMGGYKIAVLHGVDVSLLFFYDDALLHWRPILVQV